MQSSNTNTITLNPPAENETLEGSQKHIAEVCDEIKELLLEKNRKYGDSALNPTRIFAKSDSIEQIKVRIDDKLNRLKNQQGDEDEDVVQDLIGYLVLLRVAQRLKEEEDNPQQSLDDYLDWIKQPIEQPHPGLWPPYAPYPPYRIGDTWVTYNDGHTSEV